VLDHGSIVVDRPECRGVRTVFFGICDVCFAEFDGRQMPEPEPEPVGSGA
jgi:hypothetical protein